MQTINRKLISQLERDIRNQVLIDQFKKPTAKDRLMLHLHDNFRRYFWLGYFTSLFLFCFGAAAFAEDHPACPTSEPCKVIYLSPQEERLLTGQNGILDTAAQGRALDLGQFAVYLKQKIASAPAGEMQKPPAPPAVDSGVPADVKPN